MLKNIFVLVFFKILLRISCYFRSDFSGFFYAYERFTPQSLSGSRWLDRFFDTFSFAWLRIHPDEVRDPRAKVASYTRMPWGSSSFLFCNRACRSQFKSAEPYLNRIHELTLESLLESPRKVLEKLLAFIGEDWDDAVLDHLKYSPIDDVAPFFWFVGATRKKATIPQGPPL